MDMKRNFSFLVKLFFIMFLSFSSTLLWKYTATNTNIKETWNNFVFITYGQETDIDEEDSASENNKNVSSPLLDTVTRNNEVVELDEMGKVNTSNGDTIKISGIANPEETVTIFLNEKTYTAVADENGNWFVLFSITNLEDQEYIVEAQSANGDGEQSEKVNFFTLVTSTEEEMIDELSTIENDETLLQRLIKGDLRYVSIIVLCLTGLIWLLFSPIKQDPKNKKKTTKEKVS